MFSTISAILFLVFYLLVNFSSAQMMRSPTPTPTPTVNNSGISFVLIVAAIIVSIAVAVIYLFYTKNKNKKVSTFSEPKSTTTLGRQPKIETSDKASRPFDVFLCYKKSSGKDYADHLKTSLKNLDCTHFRIAKTSLRLLIQKKVGHVIAIKR